MNFWFLIIVLGASFMIQLFFTMYQIKIFSKKFYDLRNIGKVSIGVIKGGFKAGAIVMFAVDEFGNILDGTYMTGVTILARFKKIKNFDGTNIKDIDNNLLVKLPKQVQKAVLNAVSNYNKVMDGQEIVQPVSLFKRLQLSMTKSFK